MYCTVSIEHGDGSVQTIYGHSDGEIEFVGNMLFMHYKSRAKVQALIRLGDFYSLHEEIGKPGGHSRNNPANGYTVFFGRDYEPKRDEDHSAVEWASWDRAMYHNQDDDTVHYCLRYDDGLWQVCIDGKKEHLFRAVARHHGISEKVWNA